MRNLVPPVTISDDGWLGEQSAAYHGVWYVHVYATTGHWELITDTDIKSEMKNTQDCQKKI